MGCCGASGRNLAVWLTTCTVLLCFVGGKMASRNETMLTNSTVLMSGYHSNAPKRLTARMRILLREFNRLPQEDKVDLTNPRLLRAYKRRRSSFPTGTLGIKITNTDNGPILPGGVLGHLNVFLIYYGRWPVIGSGREIIESFVRSLSQTKAEGRGYRVPTVKNWWSIVSRYWYIHAVPPVPLYVSPRVSSRVWFFSPVTWPTLKLTR